MKLCDNCNKEYTEDMNYCEVCGKELSESISEDRLDLFVDEMYSPENREILKQLIALTGAEWLGKDKEFMKEVMMKFADFKARKHNAP